MGTAGAPVSVSDILQAAKAAQAVVSAARVLGLLGRECGEDGEDAASPALHPALQELSLAAAALRRFAAFAPSVLDPRRLVAMGDRAAACPLWWRANRLHAFAPDLTAGEIADMLGARRQTVGAHLRDARIPPDAPAPD